MSRLLLLLLGLVTMKDGLSFLMPTPACCRGGGFPHDAVARGGSRSSRAVTLSASSSRRGEEAGVSRGEAIIGGAAIAAGLVAMPWWSVAEEGAGGTQTYKDPKYLVSFGNIPSSWQRTDTKVGADEKDFRRLVVYKDPSSEGAAFVAYTDIRPDFASLGSFGTIKDVAKTIVPTGRDLESELIKAETVRGAYVYEYTFKPPRQPKRHLQTIFSLVPGQVLVTYTGSCLESEFESLGPIITAITESFKIDPQP